LSGENAHFSPGIDEIRAQNVVGNNQSAFGIATNNPKSLTTSLERPKDRLNMSFTRVEQDGLEFYTLKANGSSGMSIAALARLCGVEHNSIRDLLKRIHGNKTRSKWLKPFLGEDLYLAINTPGTAKIIRANVCFAIVCYYAFESRKEPAEAKYAFGKFGLMGMEGWIQGITGWKPPTPPTELTEDTVIDFITDRMEPGMIAAGIQTDALIEMLKRGDFIGSGCRLYFYLEMMHLQGETPSERQICKDLKIAPSTLRKWLPKVHAWSHCADWLQLQARKGPEYPIQLRMHEELGGKMEAFTVAGRIDLVTDTEVIEIKQIAKWKDALGEVMSKGQFFPEHHKRIHLFGASDKLMEMIIEVCSVLEILATFEVSDL
jgi:hypothetical protein